MPTTYNIKIKWTDGTTETFTSSAAISYDATGEYASFTTSDGHLHKVRMSSVKEIETWTT